MSAPHVLLVDDDASIREVARVSLEVVAGWRVTCASSGAEALAMARESDFDAMLLDVMMPGMDGVETLQSLRSDPATAELPVVFLTAKLQPGEQRQWAGLDVSGLIAKPFDPMTLAEDAARTLGWR